MYKIAVDSHIGPNLDELADFEFVIVARANEGEPDEVWVDRAILADADAFVSSDYDVPNYLEQIGASDLFHFIRMPQGKSKQQQTNFILHQLRNLNRNAK